MIDEIGSSNTQAEYNSFGLETIRKVRILSLCDWFVEEWKTITYLTVLTDIEQLKTKSLFLK